MDMDKRSMLTPKPFFLQNINFNVKKGEELNENYLQIGLL